MRPRRSVVAGGLVSALLAVGCAGDPAPTVTYGRVTTGVVTETIAAPATIEPRDRVVVRAPSSGRVLALNVADGDLVTAGDLLFQVSSSAIDSTIAQAQAAVDAAGELGSLGGVTAALDLAPVYDTVADQLEALVPPLLDALGSQAQVLPDENQQDALDRITEASNRYDETLADLRQAQGNASRAAGNASAAQRELVEAQQDQAEVALSAARGRADDLLVSAPVGGIVELSRGGDVATPDLGALGGDLESLIGGASSGSTSSSSGPVTLGSELTAGQTVLTIFDLSSFRVATTIDEIDIVDVEAGQNVDVLVDAFPDAVLDGVVDYVAIEPQGSATGGVGYPVTIRLRRVPDDVRLRVGLSGSAEVTVREVASDVVVSSSALRRRGDADVVYVVRDDIIHEVAVTVAAIGLDTAAVVGELEDGDVIVVDGIDEVADGDPAPPGTAPPNAQSRA